MTGHEIVCLAPTEWTGAWQRYQEVMRRLADSGNDVLVIDNLYRVNQAIPTTVSMAGRLAYRAWHVVREFRLTPRVVGPRLRVLSPPVPPVGGLRMFAWPVLRAGLQRAGGSASPILWAAFPSPMTRRIIDVLRPQLVVYDCASAFRKDPFVHPSVVAAEDWLLKRADLVITDSRKLWEQHSGVNNHCYWIATGVDYAEFADQGKAATRFAQEPVIGYVGTLHRWLDIELITRIVEERPGWKFVFVGPRRARTDLGRLEQLPNVRMLGPRPHGELPALLGQFDVTWIPYKLAEFTQYVFPTKLLEYLAAGRPVVSTNLPEVQKFAPPVRIGTTAQEIEEHIAAALQSPPDDRGRDLARAFDWQIQMRQIHHYLDAALATSASVR